MMPNTHATTSTKDRFLSDLKDVECRRLIYAEHISTGLPFQIRELRKKRKLTQKKLGALTGMDQSTISDIENPNYEYTPQIGTLKRLADAFDVPLFVRFGSWEDLWDWEMNLSPKKLAPSTFVEALPKLERRAKRATETTTDSSTAQMSFGFEIGTTDIKKDPPTGATAEVIHIFTRRRITHPEPFGDATVPLTGTHGS